MFARPRNIASNGPIARAIVDKFDDNMPLNCQVDGFRRAGLEVSLSTLRDLVMRSAVLLGRIVQAMRKDQRAGSWLQADDTGLPCLDGTKGHAGSGGLWVYANAEHVVYDFTPTKDGTGPAAYIGDPRWIASFLEVCASRPEIPIHNNVSELQLRPPVIGRKNWPFMGSEGGAHVAVTRLSWVGSCRVNGSDLWAYLHTILGIINDQPVSKVGQLAPLRTTLGHRDLSSATQAGFVNNLNDGMAWGLFPVLFAGVGLWLGEGGALLALRPAVRSIAQVVTRALSRLRGRCRAGWRGRRHAGVHGGP